MFKRKLSDGLERSEDGELKMTISFPDESILDNLATALARMLGTGKTVI